MKQTGHQLSQSEMIDQLRTALGEELRRIREMAGMSRQQLALLSGVHRNSIFNYEGGADLPVMTFIRLCAAMDVGCTDTLTRVLESVGKA